MTVQECFSIIYAAVIDNGRWRRLT